MLQLQKMQWKVYLPLVKEVRQWSDRKKTVELPLFKSYIFIRCYPHHIQELLQRVPGLVSTVRYNGHPATIRYAELEQIERFVKTGLHVETGNNEDLANGDEVKVIGGPLEGMEGEVLEIHNEEYFIIRIQAIQQYLKVQIPKRFLEKR